MATSPLTRKQKDDNGQAFIPKTEDETGRGAEGEKMPTQFVEGHTGHTIKPICCSAVQLAQEWEKNKQQWKLHAEENTRNEKQSGRGQVNCATAGEGHAIIKPGYCSAGLRAKEREEERQMPKQ